MNDPAPARGAPAPLELDALVRALTRVFARTQAALGRRHDARMAGLLHRADGSPRPPLRINTGDREVVEVHLADLVDRRPHRLDALIVDLPCEVVAIAERVGLRPSAPVDGARPRILRITLREPAASGVDGRGRVEVELRLDDVILRDGDLDAAPRAPRRGRGLVDPLAEADAAKRRPARDPDSLDAETDGARRRAQTDEAAANRLRPFSRPRDHG